MRITARTNADALGQRLSNAVASQTPFATALALTATAHSIREAERDEMGRVFDRPVPFVLNTFQVVPARKDRLEAEVRHKKPQGSTPTARGGRHFLVVQQEGGLRDDKPMEKLLRAVTGEPLAAAIPARGARLDVYGNWSSAERQRALSAVGARANPAQITTDRSRRRHPNRAEYYIGQRGRVRGIFRRVRDDDDELVLLFVQTPPRYQPRFAFDRVAQETWDATYAAHFEAAMTKALATLR